MENVAVTGIGFITPMGDSLSQVHQALCDGKSGLGEPELFQPEGERVELAGEISDFDASRYLGETRNLRPLNRAARLLASATQLALDEGDWTRERREEQDLGLVTGTTYCSLGIISQFDCRAQKEGPKYASALDFANTVLNSAAGQTAIWHGLRGCNSTISSGAISSIDAIAYAVEMVRSGKEEVMLAGGIEELSQEAIIGYRGGVAHCPQGQRPMPIPFDHRRNGFVLGEAAVMFVLERESVAKARGASVLARLNGFGESFCLEPHDRDGFAEVSCSAIELALGHASLSKDAIAAISLSANGSPELDSVEARATNLCFQSQANSIPIQAPKSAFGETLGAGGAIQLALMIQSLRVQKSPGISGFERSGEDVPLPFLTQQNQGIDGRVGLVNSINSDGHCHAMVVSV